MASVAYGSSLLPNFLSMEDFAPLSAVCRDALKVDNTRVWVVGGEVYVETTFQDDGKWATRFLHWPLLVDMMGSAANIPLHHCCLTGELVLRLPPPDYSQELLVLSQYMTK